MTSVTPGSASNKITDSAIHTGDDMIKTIDSVTRPGSNAVTRVRRTRRAVAAGPGEPESRAASAAGLPSLARGEAFTSKED